MALRANDKHKFTTRVSRYRDCRCVEPASTTACQYCIDWPREQKRDTRIPAGSARYAGETGATEASASRDWFGDALEGLVTVDDLRDYDPEYDYRTTGSGYHRAACPNCGQDPEMPWYDKTLLISEDGSLWRCQRCGVHKSGFTAEGSQTKDEFAASVADMDQWLAESHRNLAPVELLVLRAYRATAFDERRRHLNDLPCSVRQIVTRIKRDAGVDVSTSTVHAVLRSLVEQGVLERTRAGVPGGHGIEAAACYSFIASPIHGAGGTVRTPLLNKETEDVYGAVSTLLVGMQLIDPSVGIAAVERSLEMDAGLSSEDVTSVSGYCRRRDANEARYSALAFEGADPADAAEEVFVAFWRGFAATHGDQALHASSVGGRDHAERPAARAEECRYETTLDRMLKANGASFTRPVELQPEARVFAPTDEEQRAEEFFRPIQGRAPVIDGRIAAQGSGQRLRPAGRRGTGTNLRGSLGCLSGAQHRLAFVPDR